MSTGMKKGIKYSQDQLSMIPLFEHDFKHNAVVLRGWRSSNPLGRVRESGQNPTKFMLKRDKRASRKTELGRYLSAIDWPPLFSSLDCFEDMLNAFYKALRTGLDLLMPVKKVRVNTSDVPWMTKNLKSLTLKRQKAFHEHGIN